LDTITATPNGLQCRLRATISGKLAEPHWFECGDICYCEEDGSFWKVSLDHVWKEMI